ncbi:MAG: DUF4186 domain-containing protein [Candidatus Omnitrophota bacterium]
MRTNRMPWNTSAMPVPAKSKFRSRFKLNDKDIAYIKRTGLPVIEDHALDFICERLAPENPKNDGKQTPYKGHPVFKAQHATATCCRNCLMKWHKIPKHRDMTAAETAFVKDIIMDWIKDQAAAFIVR